MLSIADAHNVPAHRNPAWHGHATLPVHLRSSNGHLAPAVMPPDTAAASFRCFMDLPSYAHARRLMAGQAQPSAADLARLLTVVVTPRHPVDLAVVGDQFVRCTVSTAPVYLTRTVVHDQLAAACACLVDSAAFAVAAVPAAATVHHVVPSIVRALQLVLPTVAVAAAWTAAYAHSDEFVYVAAMRQRTLAPHFLQVQPHWPLHKMHERLFGAWTVSTFINWCARWVADSDATATLVVDTLTLVLSNPVTACMTIRFVGAILSFKAYPDDTGAFAAVSQFAKVRLWCAVPVPAPASPVRPVKRPSTAILCAPRRVAKRHQADAPAASDTTSDGPLELCSTRA